MNHSDISALMKGMAPVIRDLVAASVKPLLERILELETQIKTFDPSAVIRTAVGEAVAMIPPSPAGKDGADGRNVDPAEIAKMVEAAVAVIPAPKDGAPGKDIEPEALRALITEEVLRVVSALPPPLAGKDGNPGEKGEDGKDADPDLVAALVSEKVAEAVSAIPPAQSGKDGAPGEPGPRGDPGRDGIDGKDGINGTDGERGLQGPAGKLPIVRSFAGGVNYESDVVVHLGATYQALRDTANEPPHDDWICLATAGRDGADGRSLTIRGTYAPGIEYQALDVVAFNGGSFVARKDGAGECPGSDWQLIASQGKTGRPGERGLPGKGDRGEPGLPLVSATIDAMGLLTLVNGDGSTVEADLYPVLAKVATR